MGLTQKVFDDTLPNATLPYHIQHNKGGYRLTDDRRTVIIALTKMPPRVIAGLTLPRINVELNFSGHSSDEVDRFMLRFRRYFHRGGG